MSLGRLACLLRHWTWADEAKGRFEQQLAAGWDYDDDLLDDHPFGAFYHWSALLCGLADAALDDGLLSDPESGAARLELQMSLPGLQASRRRLVVVPATLEEHPRVVDLLSDPAALDQLRRLHRAFGEALADERDARERDLIEQ